MKQAIFSLIEAECHDQQFDVNHLQSSLKISNAYLWEISHAHFGLPPRELIESVRLEKVIHHIGSGDHFAFIRSKCGFGSLRTFQRAFEKRIGIPCSEARLKIMESNHKETLKFQWQNTIWRGKIPAVVRNGTTT
ncbi:MAG: helix-turn-helix domain-containing protein [Ignavibacteriae bacterium]|nr:helix-turn-helix domain-containing protein [Ignavibacteriota bacterium]